MSFLALLGHLVLGICLVEACIWEADEQAAAAASGIKGVGAQVNVGPKQVKISKN